MAVQTSKSSLLNGTHCTLQKALMDSDENDVSDTVDVDEVGNLDKESASALFRLGRYFNEKSKSDNAATHLCPVASSFAFVSMYVSGLLSVTTVNFCP